MVLGTSRPDRFPSVCLPSLPDVPQAASMVPTSRIDLLSLLRLGDISFPPVDGCPVAHRAFRLFIDHSALRSSSSLPAVVLWTTVTYYYVFRDPSGTDRQPCR